MLDANKIVKSDRCMFRGNVLLFFKQDFNNNSRVMSTGEENVFKIEKMMSRGIISDCYVNLGGVANYYVEQVAMGATCEQNFIFPKAISDAIEICRQIYRDEVAPSLEIQKLEERDKFVRDEILRSA